MKHLYAITVWVLLLTSGFSTWAHEVTSDSLILLSDSLESDTLNFDPEWYVAPVIPVSLRAPMRAQAPAASCSRVEAIQSFNIDSVLVEGTYYEYDDRGNVISTTVWTYAPDGTMTGKSKNEYAFDAAGTQTMTAVYVWEDAANDWKGTEKYEYVYKTFAGEKKMISNTSLVWLNGAWVADQRFTYDYDDAAREIEYYEYKRDLVSNDLQPFKGHVQTWTNDLQTLDILYTTYANGQWNAGTKKEWAFDENGVQTMYATYTISNGAWVGSSKETWAYNTSSKLTLHEKYGWANGWSLSLKEESEYDVNNNLIRVENYSYANGVATGLKYETTTYTSGKKTEFVTYAWSNGAWANATKETWAFTNGKQTLHEKFVGEGANWSKTLREENEYDGANLIRVENYSYANGVTTGTKKELTTYSSGTKTEFVTYTWSNGTWVNATKETWAFTNGKQTLHEQFIAEGANWSKTLREENEYSGANLIRVENYIYANGVTTGTKKEIYAYSGSDKETIVYAWESNAWIENTKEVWGYTSGMQTLHEQYVWNNAWVGVSKETWTYTSSKLTRHETYAWGSSDWSILTQENTTYSGANIIRIETYEWVNGVKTGTQKEEYIYTSGTKTKTVVYAWTNNDWVYSTKNEAGYWDGNVEVSVTNYAWNGSTWIGTGTRTKTTYDGTKVIEKLTENWPSGATDWTNAAITTNAYNAEDINVLVYNGTWDGNKWVLHSMARLDIIKDAAGHELLNASWTCGSDSVWVGVKKDTAAYTATNNPLYVASYKSWANGDWVPYSKSEYAYDANDHQILYMQYEGKNGVWVNKAKTEQAYDAAGNQTLLQGFNWSNSKWVGVYKYEYSYDTNGRQTMQAHYEWSSGRWSGFSRSDTEYDQYGNVSASISFKWKNNAWVGNSRTENVYDAKKRVVEYTLKKWQSNKWVNSRHTIYVYDSFDRLVSTRQYWWYNNEWTIYGINESTYDPSTNVLRRELSVSWLDNEIDSYSDDHYYYNCDPHFYMVRFVNYDGKVLANMTAQEGQTPSYAGVTPTREGNAEYTYTFSGWTPALAPVTANITYTATYTATKKTYTITWKSEDGSVIDQETLEYGATPTHDDATKANTAEYTYTFAGWSPGIGIVTGDATYTATFTATKNKYLITFKDEDGSVLKSEELEYGVMPTAPSDPTKASTAEDTYTFAGWDKEIVTVTEAATYTATYTTTKNSYTITWKNEDGSVIDQTTLEYGAMLMHDDATKANTAEYTYTFAGWTPTIAEVTGDATYTASFTATKNKYLITFKDEDGTILKSEELEYGVMPTAPSDPTKASTAEDTYTFAGWDKEIVTVTEAATYTATYTTTKNSYTITWKNEDGSVIDQTTLEYGATPMHDDASKANTAEYTYTFAGWTPGIGIVTGDATYTATFMATKNKYLITFKDEDGSILKSEELEYGVMPTAPSDPTKASTAEDTYTFSGWDKEVVTITEAATYTATYTTTKNSYTITWKNEDGSVIESETLEYGATPAHANIYKENTAEWTYTFAGWSPEIVPVTGDATYTATFTATKNKYLITFKDEDGTILKSEELEYGVMPTAPSDPTKASTAEYTYTFAGWTPEITSVANNETYTATYTATERLENKTFTITFYYEEGGIVVDRVVVGYGETPSTNRIPSMPSDERYYYTFSGWSPEIVPANSDADYVATFTAIPVEYRVTFKNYNGRELQSIQVPCGEMPEYTGEIPTRPSDKLYTYTFIGWTPEITEVTGNATYTALFETVSRTQDVEEVQSDNVQIEKVLKNGILYIMYNGTKYNLQGQRMQ